MKTLIKKWLHRQLRVQIHRPKRGSDFFDDIDRDFGIDSLATVFDVGANMRSMTKFPTGMGIVPCTIATSRL